jgi:hypothetical protein
MGATPLPHHALPCRPIVFLRAFSTVFFQVLDVMSVSLFLIALNCNYFDVDPSVQYTLEEYPEYSESE